jgi:hypothetical protein
MDSAQPVVVTVTLVVTVQRVQLVIMDITWIATIDASKKDALTTALNVIPITIVSNVQIIIS